MKKFAARYQHDDELSIMVRAMKAARKTSGYSQEELGKLIGISRETVLHIEGMMECSVLSLECEVLKRWFWVCSQRIGPSQCEALRIAINDYLFTSLTSSKNQQQKVA